MRSILYCLAVLLSFGCKSNPSKNSEKPQKEEKQIQVETNRNIETIGIILSLSELGDFIIENSKNNPDKEYTYIKINRFFYKDLAQHPAVLKANELNAYNLLQFNHYYYGLYFTPLPAFEESYPLDSVFYGYGRNNLLTHPQIDSLLASFNQSVRDFYKAADLEKEFEKDEEFYSIIKQEVKNSIPQKHIAAMESFFGTGQQNKYIICPSASIPTSFNFGTPLQQYDTSIYYFVTGPSHDPKIKEKANPKTIKDSLGFNQAEYIADLAIHEFSHSFVRFVDEDVFAKQIDSLAYLNTKTLQQNLKSIGQGTNWRTGFEEHLVRATEVMILRELGMKKEADEKLDYEFKDEGFIYIHQFVKSLAKYQQARDRYPTLESYFTVLLKDIEQIP